MIVVVEVVGVIPEETQAVGNEVKYTGTVVAGVGPHLCVSRVSLRPAAAPSARV